MRIEKLIQVLFLSIFYMLGCDDEDAVSQAQIAQARAIEGEYTSTGQWDLSGPLKNDETIGELTGDLFVELLVKQIGVPSRLKNDAERALGAVLRRPTADAIDRLLPELTARGTKETLSALLAELQIDSKLQLTAKRGILNITETISAITVQAGEEELEIPSELLVGDEMDTTAISSSYQGTPKGDRLVMSSHGFAIRFDLAIVWLLDEFVFKGEDFKMADISERLGCDSFNEQITFESISVGGFSINPTPTHIQRACAQLVSKIESQILGIFTADTGITLGGSVLTLDDDKDGQVERLESAEDYQGEWTVVLNSTAPNISVDLQAVRVE